MGSQRVRHDWVTKLNWKQDSYFVLLLFSHKVMSNSLWSHRMEHSRLARPSLSPRICLISCPLIQWFLSKHLILCYSLLLLPLIFSSIRVFPNESALYIRWTKDCSFCFSPSNEYSGLISFSIDCLISLLSKGLSRVFSSTTVQKHRFFGAQPSLWSNSHIHTWLPEKP